MYLNFEPIGKLTAKKQYHYICIALAVILPIALIAVTLIKGTFSPATLLVCAGIVVVAFGIDYSNRSNIVAYSKEQIALLGMFGKVTTYRWEDLTSVMSDNSSMRLDFAGGKKLYINMEYDGINAFITYLNSITESK
ncbi:MAG: hypothetical protein PUC41_07885 [Oscillospiraceae bacterium]|nr:hypothetical protein [Oscillospiraceae bacterium]